MVCFGILEIGDALRFLDVTTLPAALSAPYVRKTTVLEKKDCRETIGSEVVGPLFDGNRVGAGHAVASQGALVVAAISEIRLAAAAYDVELVHSILELVQLATAIADRTLSETVLSGFDALQTAVLEMQVTQQLSRSKVVRPNFVLGDMWQKEIVPSVIPFFVVLIAPQWLTTAKPNVGFFHANTDEFSSAAERVGLNVCRHP